MRKINKVKAPHFLKKNWKKWGLEWKNKYKDPDQKNTFNWKCNREELIIDYLAKSTQDHCSFCDIDNITIGSGATIEHFKPKSKYHKIAYHYNNLFNCCNECQKKIDDYSNLLLKPDIDSFSFETYFEIDIYTGKICPNINATPQNQKRADETIKLYRLNYGEKPRLRLKSLENYLKSSGLSINDFSYRFFIEAYNNI
ncbi:MULTISPECIES: hypothetical protein [unclassified Tenacibaculum]|uniref:hypothetical protein n=1 Tax=unclassified Tenacibaculum TaxID=2635139 RepID=UPI001F32BEEA|nr:MULTISPECIES: hypothetical protein [unclassified Tenacibaculum]MCF2873344.1 hypothetical protein [Tenacibaculum sp. Cn5-1]MCF2933500.1 hypothetical protein [Tenacibaculum sp. Cn5-34]MCG7509918.1 hypothetical protein [Tenacibaculum sp. Cn5-46]